MEIRRRDVLAVYGRKGTGKSELSRALWIEQHSPRILIDPKDEHAHHLPGVPTVDSPTEVFSAMNPTVRAVPEKPNDRDWYDELYTRALKEGDIVIWLDEANAVTSPNYVPEGIRSYILRGRVRDCGHIGCTPRPADTHPVFLSQADHVFVFPVRHDLDRKAIARHVDAPIDELAVRLDALPQFGFLHFEAESGQLATMGPSHDPDELTARIAGTYFGPYRPGWLT